MANGIHHVVIGDIDDGKWPKVSACGKKMWNYDMPIGVEHAENCIRARTYLQPCRNCMKIIRSDK